MTIKHELQSIISGNGSVRNGKIIQTITDYLRGKKKAGTEFEKEWNKDQETEVLIEYITDNNLWYSSLDESKYIDGGAEQKVYEFENLDFVVKVNDSIFYKSWHDYFINLLIHNFLFKRLAYELKGFIKYENSLCAVVVQPFINATENTNLIAVKEFLEANGFINKKNNDYFHPELGIIIEDLHDENVLTSEGVLQFIDTVIYLTDEFYAD